MISVPTYAMLREHSEYRIDFLRGEAKYIDTGNGVHVYESGLVLLHDDTDRNLSARHKLAGWGLEFAQSAEVTGLEYFTPDGTPLKKRDIPPQTLLYDREYGKCVACRWGRPIMYVHPNAQPVGGYPIDVWYLDSVKLKLLRAAIKDHVALGRTLASLSVLRGASTEVRPADWLRSSQTILASGGKLPPPEVVVEEDYGQYVLSVLGRWDMQGNLHENVVTSVHEHRKYDYLLFKEKSK